MKLPLIRRWSFTLTAPCAVLGIFAITTSPAFAFVTVPVTHSFNNSRKATRSLTSRYVAAAVPCAGPRSLVRAAAWRAGPWCVKALSCVPVTAAVVPDGFAPRTTAGGRAERLPQVQRSDLSLRPRLQPGPARRRRRAIAGTTPIRARHRDSGTSVRNRARLELSP
jgi:hypothetical protein